MTQPDPRPEHTPCSDWPSRLDVRGPDHFLELVNELRAANERGELDVLHASHPFDAVMQDGKWTSDGFLWRVRCRASGKCYQLAADTYHGRALCSEVAAQLDQK